MKKTISKLFVVSTLVLITVFAVAPAVYAQGSGFTPLTNVPGIFDNSKPTNPIEVLRGFYGLAIGIGAVLAVVIIILAGFKYMYEESIFGKSSAREQITNAFIGLAVILGSYILLRTINTNLVNFDLSLPGAAGGVQKLIASQAQTDAINAALKKAANDSTERLKSLETLKKNLSDDQSRLETLKKQPHSIERDTLIADIESKIKQTTNNINQKTIEHIESTNADIITKSKAKEFDREITKLNEFIAKGDITEATLNARTSLSEISTDIERQISILNKNMNNISELQTTDDIKTTKENLIVKTGQDIAYLGTSKNMINDLHKSIDTVGFVGVRNQSTKFDEIINIYNKQADDFEAAGRKDLAENLRNDIEKATEIMKIRQIQNCASQTDEIRQTLTLCKQ